MSFVIARQPHFPNQADDVKVFWGYGLYPNRMGNFVKKKMADCTGEEMLQELWHHLKIRDLMDPVMASGKINCIPVAMPFVDSLFMPRSPGDRPDVLPRGSTNMHFLASLQKCRLIACLRSSIRSDARKWPCADCLKPERTCYRSMIQFTFPAC